MKKTEDLPKALSAEERIAMFGTTSFAHDTRRRALALIDALTAALAESVARMTVAEQKERAAWDEANAAGAHARTATRARERQTERLLKAEAQVARLQGSKTRVREAELTAERDAALARAEAAERAEKDAVQVVDDNWVTHQRVVAAESEAASLREKSRLLEVNRDGLLARNGRLVEESNRAHAESAALRAENERLRAEATLRMVEHAEAHEYEQLFKTRLAAANALLERWQVAWGGGVATSDLYERTRAHLAGQKA